MSASDAVVVEPNFPCLLGPSIKGPTDTTAITANGQLLLVNGRGGIEALDCPNVTTLVQVSGLPEGKTHEDVTASMTQQLLGGLEGKQPVDRSQPHVTLLWNEYLGEAMMQTLCNVVALVLARHFRLRDWEAREAARVCFETHLPGAWSTSLESEARYHQAYAQLSPALVLFYGHDPKYAPYHVFSQFYLISYVGADGVTLYNSSEQEMHAQKALLFGDRETYTKILKAKSPYQHKKLGRQVRGFDKARWEQECFAIVARANVAKFGSTPAMRAILLATGDSELYEATAGDSIWAIGLDVDVAARTPKTAWRGTNLLGKALVYARNQLKK